MKQQRYVSEVRPTMTSDPSKTTTWDHSSDQNFVDYYAQQSLTQETVQHFTRIRDKSLRLLAKLNGDSIRLCSRNLWLSMGSDGQGQPLSGFQTNR